MGHIVQLHGTMAAGAIGAALVLSACGLDELAALAEADRSIFATPTLRASGQFSDVRVVYSSKHHALAVALNHDEETPRLSITPLLGTTCFAGPARRFEVSRRTEETGLVAAIQGESLEVPAPIRVVTYDCDEVVDLPEARWVSSYFGALSHPGMTFATARGSVLFIEEDAGVVHELTRDADQVHGVGSEVWALADGELQRWTSPFVAPTVWSGVDVVVSDGSRLAFSGEDGVYFVFYGHITRVADEGCRLTLIDGGLSFESPCGSQRTVAHAQAYRYDPPPAEPWLGSVVEFPVDVEPSEVRITSGEHEFYYLRLNVDPDGVAEFLMVAGRDGWPSLLGTQHRRTRSGIFVDWDGRAGRLISPRFTANGDRLSVSSIRTIASNVAEHLGRAFLVDFDGTTGELRSPDGLRVYGHAAPPQELVGPPGGVLRAFLADYDGSSGNLYVLEDPEADPQVVANDVALGTVQFFHDGSSTLYLTQPRSGFGTLRAHHFDAEVEQVFATGVSEFVVEPGGVVYAVRSGEAPGLYWAPRR